MNHISGCPQKQVVSGECRCRAIIEAEANAPLLATIDRLQKEIAELKKQTKEKTPPEGGVVKSKSKK